jgi:hypothetical protein
MTFGFYGCASDSTRCTRTADCVETHSLRAQIKIIKETSTWFRILTKTKCSPRACVTTGEIIKDDANTAFYDDCFYTIE